MLAMCLGLGAAAPAQQAPVAERTPGEAAYEAFLTDVRALKAEFRQELWADDELLETTSGSMALARPNRFYWRYAAPYEQLLVADGERVWSYDVELEQVTVAPLDSTGEASPALLLSGDAAVRDSFAVVTSFALDGLDWVELEPTRGAADFSSVLIGFAGVEPRRIELVDGLSQVTRIELTNVVLEPELPNDLFDFQPPAGVDVIGADG